MKNDPECLRMHGANLSFRVLHHHPFTGFNHNFLKNTLLYKVPALFY